MRVKDLNKKDLIFLSRYAADTHESADESHEK